MSNEYIADLEKRLAYLEQKMLQIGQPNSYEPYQKNHELQKLQENLVDELQNFGCIQPLLEDNTINDVLINSTKSIYIERYGKLIRTDINFPDDAEVFKIAEKITHLVGRSINPARPLVDTRLQDGSRVNIIAPPLSVDGTVISIRKFSNKTITLDAMGVAGNISPMVAEFLKLAGECRLNMVVSGGTGSGKTTLLNAISKHINDDERIVTIEDAAELRLQQPHVIRLETKPLSASMRPEDEVSMRDLVRNALRMRPDRIIVGEIRGPEAFDMLQAMNTGHEGSFTTIHANHPRDALARLENMIAQGLSLPSKSIRAQIASAVNIIVQISRMRDGVRRIQFVSEITGMEGDTIVMQNLFQYVVTGETPDGFLVGEWKWTGIMPRCLQRITYYGQEARLEECLNVKIKKR